MYRSGRNIAGHATSPQSAEAGKPRLGSPSLLGEFPIEKYRAKTSAFEVVTKSNRVHSGCWTEPGGMDSDRITESHASHRSPQRDQSERKSRIRDGRVTGVQT